MLFRGHHSRLTATVHHPPSAVHRLPLSAKVQNLTFSRLKMIRKVTKKRYLQKNKH
jgi:hypothetical protein